MSKLDKEQVIAQFIEAYKAAHGKAPQIEAKGGWYSVDGGKNLRLAQLEEMIAELGGAPAPKTKAKANTGSTSKARPAAAPKSSGFSVKAYWAEQLAEKGQVGRQPR